MVHANLASEVRYLTQLEDVVLLQIADQACNLNLLEVDASQLKWKHQLKKPSLKVGEKSSQWLVSVPLTDF